MNDDLAVPQALALISEALRIGNTAITVGDKKVLESSANEIRGALEVLGCDPFDAVFAHSGGSNLTALLDGTIQLALVERASRAGKKRFCCIRCDSRWSNRPWNYH